MAASGCRQCHGSGIIDMYNSVYERACECVARKVFTSVMRKREKILLEQSGGKTWVARNRMHTYSRPLEEYLADVESIARRVLDQSDYALYERRYLQGASLGGSADDRYTYGRLYLIQAWLGYSFSYEGLFPFSDYFRPRKEEVAECQPVARKRDPLGPRLSAPFRSRQLFGSGTAEAA